MDRFMDKAFFCIFNVVFFLRCEAKSKIELDGGRAKTFCIGRGERRLSKCGKTTEWKANKT